MIKVHSIKKLILIYLIQISEMYLNHNFLFITKIQAQETITF